MIYFFRYLRLSVKRAAKAFPTVMTITLVLCFGVVLTSLVVMRTSENDDSRRRVKVGVVGDVTESYLGVGLSAIKNIDDSRFAIDLIHIASEEEARELLDASEISSYILIPDGFVESIVSGDNAPLTYVLKKTSAPLGSVLMSEVASSVSSLVTESQTGVSAIQEYCLDLGMGDDSYDVGEEANIVYISSVLKRGNLIDSDLAEGSDALGLYAYVFCGAVAFFLMLWGITCSPLFARRDSLAAFERLTESRLGRKGTVITVIGDWISFFVLAETILIVLSLLGGIAIPLTGIDLPEIKSLGSTELAVFAVKLTPAVIALTAFEFLLFELTDSIVGSILLQFTAAASLGYISGCFYPVQFFPEPVQKLAAVLPSGAAFSCVRQAFAGSGPSLGSVAPLIGYAVVFVVVAIAARAIRVLKPN